MQLTITRQLIHLEKNVLANNNNGQQATNTEPSTTQNNFSIKIRQKQRGGKRNRFSESKVVNN